MSEPDYDFWRAERARLTSKDLSLADIVSSIGTALNAIDLILEMEATICDLRERVTQLEKMIENHLERWNRNQEYFARRRAELDEPRKFPNFSAALMLETMREIEREGDPEGDRARAFLALSGMLDVAR